MGAAHLQFDHQFFQGTVAHIQEKSATSLCNGGRNLAWVLTSLACRKYCLFRVVQCIVFPQVHGIVCFCLYHPEQAEGFQWNLFGGGLHNSFLFSNLPAIGAMQNETSSDVMPHQNIPAAGCVLSFPSLFVLSFFHLIFLSFSFIFCTSTGQTVVCTNHGSPTIHCLNPDLWAKLWLAHTVVCLQKRN